MKHALRHDWTITEIGQIYEQPLLELIHQAALIHRHFHQPQQVQVCHLISVKTGGCPENCKYCAQSSNYQTTVEAQTMMSVENVIQRAKEAIAKGASRICLGAAWRAPRPGKQFDLILRMVQEINAMGVEVCCTLGMLNDKTAKQLQQAGLYAYNHNLDTSEQYYKEVVTTRTYAERLNTLAEVEKVNVSVCCGGIIGLGEKREDRLNLLQTLANRENHPESFPVNFLVPIPGTPYENNSPISVWESIRMIATARCIMPNTMVRLSAGRLKMSYSEQALCFMAGANSIHSGEKLLTVSNPDFNADDEMFELLGLEKMPSFQNKMSSR